MWPALFGAGWVWGALVAAALACFIVGVLGFLFQVVTRPVRRAPDEIDAAWHLYEEGDLTREEWARRMRSLRASRPMTYAARGRRTGETGGI